MTCAGDHMPRPAQFEAFRQAALARRHGTGHEPALCRYRLSAGTDSSYEDAPRRRRLRGGRHETARAAFQVVGGGGEGAICGRVRSAWLLGYWLRDRGEGPTRRA